MYLKIEHVIGKRIENETGYISDNNEVYMCYFLFVGRFTQLFTMPFIRDKNRDLIHISSLKFIFHLCFYIVAFGSIFTEKIDYNLSCKTFIIVDFLVLLLMVVYYQVVVKCDEISNQDVCYIDVRRKSRLLSVVGDVFDKEERDENVHLKYGEFKISKDIFSLAFVSLIDP